MVPLPKLRDLLLVCLGIFVVRIQKCLILFFPHVCLSVCRTPSVPFSVYRAPSAVLNLSWSVGPPLPYSLLSLPYSSCPLSAVLCLTFFIYRTPPLCLSYSVHPSGCGSFLLLVCSPRSHGDVQHERLRRVRAASDLQAGVGAGALPAGPAQALLGRAPL